MASVHQRPGSKFWHGAWRDAKGKLHLQSTKQTERKKALAFVMEIERAERVEGLTESKAREILNGILERAGNGESIKTPPTVRDYFTGWMEGKGTTKADSTVERYQGVVDGFLAHLANGANQRLESLTTKDVEAFLAKRRKTGVSPGTVSLDCKILSAAFEKARRQGIIPTNPAEGVELEKVRHVERGTFKPAEISILVDTAQGEWKTLILTAYFSGQRLGDCCRLAWSEVNFTEGTLTFNQQKTDEMVVVPIHPDLAAHLEALAGDKPDKYVMPHLATLGPGGRHGLSEGFKRIMVKAGLDLGTVQGHGTRKISKRSFHALRHSFNSAMANAGVSQELRMKLTGHRSKEVNRGYTHHELENLRGAVSKVPSLTKAAK